MIWIIIYNDWYAINGISTIVGYIMLNPVYMYIYK